MVHSKVCGAGVDRKITTDIGYVIYTGLWNHFGRERRKEDERRKRNVCSVPYSVLNPGTEACYFKLSHFSLSKYTVRWEFIPTCQF